MKRIGLISILLGLGIINTYSQDSIVSIPDTAFLYALINEGVDTNGDSLISYGEAEQINALYICAWGIVDMTGIEAFVYLDTLICGCNEFQELILSNNPYLQYLDCNGRTHWHGCGDRELEGEIKINPTFSLQTLDISQNLLLKTLDCHFNGLTSLDVSNNLLLETLNCAVNNLTCLDLSNNSSLKELNCGTNDIASLNLSNNTQLTEIGLLNMPSLIEVCVWETPFPPVDVGVNTSNSPFIIFTTQCGSLNIPPDKYAESFREIQEDLYRERPQIGDDSIRTNALITVDYLIGRNLEHPDPIKVFFDKMFTKALYEIRNEQVTSGATVWQIYNHGFVVKTRTKTFGIDLTNLIRNEKFGELADLLDAYFISHSDGDHHDGELSRRMNGLGKSIIGPAEWLNPTSVGMEAGETLDIKGLKVTAHYGLHSAPVRQYEITTPEGIKILHTGDNQTSETIPEVSDVNILLLNAWVNESGDASSTVGISNAISKINPDVCLLGHIQEYVNHGENASKYSTVIAGDLPPEAHILAWGERYHFDDSSNDTICPNKAKNLECNIGNDSLFLNWEIPQASEDGERATFYRVKIDDIDDFFLSGTQYSIGWDSVRTYNFKVFSYDECGNQSKDYAEIDVELSADMNFSPRISSTYPFKIDTVDLFAGVYKVFWTESWDPNHDSLSYSWELDREPIMNVNSPEFHFAINGLVEGLHILSCIVSDQQVSVRNDWIVDFHTNMAVIDNEDVLMYSEQGEWQGQMLSTAYQLSCRWSKRENTKDWAQFVYYPQKSGIYDVYQINPRTDYALNNAVYMITMGNDILDSIHIDQNEGCGDWVRIGQYFIEAGSEVKVTVINTGSATSGYALYVDAIKFEFLENVGIGDNAISDQLSSKDIAVKIYPNPAEERLFIESMYMDNFDVEVIDNSGQRVFHSNFRGSLFQFDLSFFQKGVYFITIRSKDFVTVRKIVKL